LKRGNTTLKRGKALKRSNKSAEDLEEVKEQQKKDWDFYMEIWNERPHHCEVTDKYLGSVPYTTMFHHILPKHRYPEYRYCKKNIALLYPSVHEHIEGGSIFPIMKAREEELKQLHQEGLLS